MLGFAAYAAALVAGWITTAFSAVIPVVAGITVSWRVGFTALTAAFSRHGWRTQTARATDASMVPDFTGRWEGYVKTSYDGYMPDEALHELNNPEADMQRVAATLQINQTWRTITIHLKTDNSEQSVLVQWC